MTVEVAIKLGKSAVRIEEGAGRTILGDEQWGSFCPTCTEKG